MTTSRASLARARTVDEMRELGQKAAAIIRAGGYQEKAALACGIHESTFYRWLDSDDEAAMAFSAEVKAAIFERAEADERKAESDIGSAENGSSAWAGWWKWKLSQRYRKLFGDLTQKVELSGPDGSPIQVQPVPSAAMDPVQVIERVRELAEAGDERAIALLEEAKRG